MEFILRYDFMKTIAPLTSFDQIKLLSDPRRLEILRLLMAESATLSQLGRVLGRHPAWVQHHIKALEAGGLVEIAEVRVTAGVTEKFYRARAGGFLLQEMILPLGGKPALVFRAVTTWLSSSWCSNSRHISKFSFTLLVAWMGW